MEEPLEAVFYMRSLPRLCNKDQQENVLGPRWDLTPRLTSHLTANCNVALTLIRIMAYACPTWEYAADILHLKLQ
jgi:hypothetical protein